MEIYKLDRIEEDFAVLESPSGKMISVSKNRLPENSTDGDCFILSGENFIYSEEETKKRRRAVFDILSGIISKN